MCTEHQHLNFVRFVAFIALTVLFQEHQSAFVNAAPASPTSEHSAEPPSPSYIDDYISKHQSQKSPAKMSENKGVTKRSSENVREVNNEIDENGAKIHSFLLKNKETKDREDKNVGAENSGQQKSHASAGDIENDTNAKVDKNQNTETLSGRTNSESMADKESPATDANDEDSNGKQSEKSDLNSDKVEEKDAKNEKPSLEKSSEGGKNSNSTKKTIWPSTSTIKKLTRQRRVENEGETSQSEENKHEIKANKTQIKSDDGANVESATPDPIPKHQTAMTEDGTQTDDDEQIPSPVTTKKVQKSRENEHSVETFADVDNEPKPVTLTTTTPYTPTSSTTATETASEGAVVEAQIKPSTLDEQKDTDTAKTTDKSVEKGTEKGSESEANKETGKVAETNEGGEIGKETKSEGNKGKDSTTLKEMETKKSETAINKDKETEAKTEKESDTDKTSTTIGQKAARRGDKSLGTVDDEKNSESNADEAEKPNKNVDEKNRKKEDDNRKTDDEGKPSKNDDVKDKTQKSDNKSSVEREKSENSAETNNKREKNSSGRNSVENIKVGEENERDKNGNREQKPIAIEQRQTEEKMKTDGKTGDVTVTSDSKKTSGKRHHEDLTSTEEEKEHAAANKAGKDESSMLPDGNEKNKRNKETGNEGDTDKDEANDGKKAESESVTKNKTIDKEEQLNKSQETTTMTAPTALTVEANTAVNQPPAVGTINSDGAKVQQQQQPQQPKVQATSNPRIVITTTMELIPPQNGTAPVNEQVQATWNATATEKLGTIGTKMVSFMQSIGCGIFAAFLPSSACPPQSSSTATNQASESATKPPPFPAFGVGALELPKKDIVKAAKMPQIAPPEDDGVDDEDEGEPIIFNGAKEVDLTPDEIPEPPQYDDYVEEDPNNPGQMEQQYYVDENGNQFGAMGANGTAGAFDVNPMPEIPDGREIDEEFDDEVERANEQFEAEAKKVPRAWPH